MKRWLQPSFRDVPQCSSCRLSSNSVTVLQGEPQSMAMIYQLVTQACEHLVHSKKPWEHL